MHRLQKTFGAIEKLKNSSGSSIDMHTFVVPEVKCMYLQVHHDCTLYMCNHCRVKFNVVSDAEVIVGTIDTLTLKYRLGGANTE